MQSYIFFFKWDFWIKFNDIKQASDSEMLKNKYIDRSSAKLFLVVKQLLKNKKLALSKRESKKNCFLV